MVVFDASISDHDGIRRFARRLGIEVIGISELPVPPDDPQDELFSFATD